MPNFTNIKNELTNFKKKNDQLKILQRTSPVNSDFFFKGLYKNFFSVTGFVKEDNPKKDIQNLFKDIFSLKIQRDPFYDYWLDDMAQICKIFCSFLNHDKLSFWLGSSRGCKRFHVDMVPFRLLVTYSGQGTELLPNYAADRDAFNKGKSNNLIVKDKSACTFIDKWDIAIFRGGNNGILHRTPDSALSSNSSILMRLDNASFLEDIEKINKFV